MKVQIEILSDEELDKMPTEKLEQLNQEIQDIRATLEEYYVHHVNSLLKNRKY